MHCRRNSRNAGNSMVNNVSEYATADLMDHVVRDGVDRESIYATEQILLRRWRAGSDLSFLVELIQSERSRDRLRGGYYLGELGEAVDGLRVPVIALADDPLSGCRRTFVGYIMNSGEYDDVIGAGLAKCLRDLDVFVRAATIKWAVHVSDGIFEAFSRLIWSEVGARRPAFRNPISNDFWNDANLKRALRGLEIARQIRLDEKIDDIRKDFPEEDSFVLDSLHFSQTRDQRLLKEGQ